MVRNGQNVSIFTRAASCHFNWTIVVMQCYNLCIVPCFLMSKILYDIAISCCYRKKNFSNGNSPIILRLITYKWQWNLSRNYTQLYSVGKKLRNGKYHHIRSPFPKRVCKALSIHFLLHWFHGWLREEVQITLCEFFSLTMRYCLLAHASILWLLAL